MVELENEIQFHFQEDGKRPPSDSQDRNIECRVQSR